MYENEGTNYMEVFNGGAKGWEIPCVVHHFTELSDFQNTSSNINAVIIFTISIVEFQH